MWIKSNEYNSAVEYLNPDSFSSYKLDSTKQYKILIHPFSGLLFSFEIFMFGFHIDKADSLYDGNLGTTSTCARNEYLTSSGCASCGCGLCYIHTPGNIKCHLDSSY